MRLARLKNLASLFFVGEIQYEDDKGKLTDFYKRSRVLEYSILQSKMAAVFTAAGVAPKGAVPAKLVLVMRSLRAPVDYTIFYIA